ncbi:MAG TPA: DUF3048 domain-containing protein [Acidimicrobiia bacterium]|nr:DUF3048 domain-containing protein [Acidimicrobiia bacterium]
MFDPTRVPAVPSSAPRSRRALRIGALVAGLGLLAGACGGGGGDTSTTTTAAKSTTTLPPAAPLTGVPLDDTAALSRPAVAGKIGNNPEARPQVGLNDADLVFEEEVEGRITRFLAVFHSTLPERFGPVRSVRVMDPFIIQPIGGIFGFSGGAAGVVSEVLPKFEAGGITVFDESKAAGAGATLLDRNHANGVRPNILFYLPQKLIAAAGSTTPPNPVFTYLGTGEKFGGQPAATVVVPVGPAAFNPTWRWNATKKLYERAYGTTPFLTDGAEQVGAENIVVQFVGQGADLALGSGEAWVFSDGQFKKGTWTRDDPAKATQYLDETGQPIKLTPGRTWVELPLAGGGQVQVTGAAPAGG